MTGLCGVVLAAGRSTRMGSENKLTTQIGGKPLVWFPVRHLREAGVSRVVVVVGHDRENVMRSVGDGVVFVFQEDQRGTGHAIMQAVPAFTDEDTIIVVLFGDCPFIDPAVIRGILATHERLGADVTIATATLQSPRSLGIVERDEKGLVTKVKEPSESRNRSLSPCEIFVGLSVWRRETIESVLPQLTWKPTDEAYEELYLTEAFELVRNGGGKLVTFSDVPEGDALGPNTPSELLRATEYLRTKVLEHQLSRGVRIPDPQGVRIDFEVEIGTGTTIHSNTSITGSSRVSKNCEIGPDSILVDCTVDDDCSIGRGSWNRHPFRAGTRARDRLADSPLHFRRPYFEIPEERDLCFGILPFSEPYLEVWNNLIAKTLERAGFRPRIAQRSRMGVVYEEIWEDINRAGLVVADISIDNPNVWYELGLAHALNKAVMPLCQVTRKKRKLPFDIQHSRVLFYDPKKQDLLQQLEQWLTDFNGRR